MKSTDRPVENEAGAEEGRFSFFFFESRPRERPRRFAGELPFLFSATCSKRDGLMMRCVTLMCVRLSESVGFTWRSLVSVAMAMFPLSCL